MPRAKYTRPPGPFPAIEQIKRAKFHFRIHQRRTLGELLPRKLLDLSVPPDAPPTLPEKVKTIADLVIQATEDAINSHLTVSSLTSEIPLNPANARAAIRRLRSALIPFVRGSLDEETANIVPGDLEAKLAVREREISELRLPSARQRALAMLCQVIGAVLIKSSSLSGEPISNEIMLRYVDAALNFARIKHPSIGKHRRRLAALVFPKDRSPQTAG